MQGVLVCASIDGPQNAHCESLIGAGEMNNTCFSQTKENCPKRASATEQTRLLFISREDIETEEVTIATPFARDQVMLFFSK